MRCSIVNCDEKSPIYNCKTCNNKYCTSHFLMRCSGNHILKCDNCIEPIKKMINGRRLNYCFDCKKILCFKCFSIKCIWNHILPDFARCIICKKYATNNCISCNNLLCPLHLAKSCNKENHGKNKKIDNDCYYKCGNAKVRYCITCNYNFCQLCYISHKHLSYIRKCDLYGCNNPAEIGGRCISHGCRLVQY